MKRLNETREEKELGVYVSVTPVLKPSIHCGKATAKASSVAY